MRNKILLFFSILILILSLSSCVKSAKKDTAYCFSAVFDANENGVNITLYCRVPDKASAESTSDKETPLALSGKSIKEALNSDMHSKYEIYYNSMVSVYFTENITRDHYIEVASELYNKTKYQTAITVYSPKNGAVPTAEEIHSAAMEICTHKGIKEEDKNNYVNFTEFIRSNTAKKG